MSKKSWSILLFFLILIGIIVEVIFLLFLSNKKPTNNSTQTQTPPLAVAKSSTITLGNILVPLPGKPGGVTITGILKNVYTKNNKIYADIVFEDSFGKSYENNNIVLTPFPQATFILREQTTPDLAPVGNVVQKSISFAQAQQVLHSYVGQVMIWNFNASIPVISSLPANLQADAQKIIPYHECNQMFLTNLQNNTFVFPHCELYAGTGGIYVQNTK